ncbi:hypothetical protein KCP71_11045 [Salmonella enterica subsp. enterica]|nr:hypothetical protein KCP71_11045 [Salmonella enterica subsp. enterica]
MRLQRRVWTSSAFWLAADSMEEAEWRELRRILDWPISGQH